MIDWRQIRHRIQSQMSYDPIRQAISTLFKLSESPAAFGVIGATGIALLILANIGSHLTQESRPASNNNLLAHHSETANADTILPEKGQETVRETQQAASEAGPVPSGQISDKTNQSADARAADLTPKVELFQLRRGETLIGMLKRAGIQNGNAHAAVNALGTIADLRKLRPDHTMTLTRAPKDRRRIESLVLRTSFDNEAHVQRREATFDAFNQAVPTLSLTRYVEGEITDSLYLSAKRQGLPEKTIIELIRLMSFDVDFQRDIRKGDTFNVYFERRYAPAYGDVDEGSILKASLTLRGEDYEATYFESADGETGYYDAAGKSTQKALMKTPVEGARLSSGFGRRKHPILGYNRLHKGVDFAAPRGTPIMAAGNGTVEMATRNGSFGNYIRIRHGNSYKTAYAHLKSYARGIKKGAKVKQGQIIGYIGTTGRSTGPHLHYEVLLSGKQVNPQTLKLPTARRLKGADIERYEVKRDYYLTEIAQIRAATNYAEQQSAPTVTSR